jgi:hypothetical protein
MTDTDREQTARRYLLAQLSPDDAERFEEQLLDDRSLRELTEAAEADLHDAFVRDELTPKEREIFFARFGNRVERIEFADALRSRARRPQSRRWLLPVAAALLIAAGLAAYWNTRSTPARQQATSRTTTREAVPSQAQTTSVAPERRRARPHPERATAKVAMLTIALTAARDESAVPQLELPADAESVALRVRIHRGDDYPRYEVHWTVGGADVWTGPATREPSSTVVEATIPAAQLSAKRYEIIVVGIDDNDTREILGTRAVIVTR